MEILSSDGIISLETMQSLVSGPQVEFPTNTYSKTCLKWPLKKEDQNFFLDRLSLSAGQKYCRMLQGEHSAILSTFIKLPFVSKLFVLSIFEWPLKTGFTVYYLKNTLYLFIEHVSKLVCLNHTEIRMYTAIVIMLYNYEHHSHCLKNLLKTEAICTKHQSDRHKV